MGIPYVSARFLVEAAHGGVSFDATATIGRQTLMASPISVNRLLRRTHGPNGPSLRVLQSEPWADDLFHALGAREVTSIDASSYEGASIVADLNHPVPGELENRYSAIFDGGSLEHVFNAPEALRSYMRMVRVGGHVLMTVPANNYFGHGFYQFGPDFFFRAFSEENGFVMERLIAAPEDVDSPGRFMGGRFYVSGCGPRYQVVDPQEAAERVQLVNRKPVLLLAQARKVRETDHLSVWPQQSDYMARWNEPGVSESPSPGGSPPRFARERLFIIRDALPRLSRLIDPGRPLREARNKSFRNRRHFRRLRR